MCQDSARTRPQNTLRTHRAHLGHLRTDPAHVGYKCPRTSTSSGHAQDACLARRRVLPPCGFIVVSAAQAEATEMEQIFRDNERAAQQMQGRTADMGTQQHWGGRVTGLRQAREGGRRVVFPERLVRSW